MLFADDAVRWILGLNPVPNQRFGFTIGDGNGRLICLAFDDEFAPEVVEREIAGCVGGLVGEVEQGTEGVGHGTAELPGMADAGQARLGGKKA